MNEERYEAISRPFRDNPSALRMLTLVNDGLKWLCYVLYPVLLVLLALHEPAELLRAILTPAVLFVGLSAFRRLYDAPRPYEALGSAHAQEHEGEVISEQAHLLDLHDRDVLVGVLRSVGRVLARMRGFYGRYTRHRGRSLPQRRHRGCVRGHRGWYRGLVGTAPVLVLGARLGAWPRYE